MSRTVSLYAPSTTRAGTAFGLLTPRNIHRAVNAGQQAANLARNIYQGISNTLRSPRISAGSIRNNQDMPRFQRSRARRSIRSARSRVRRRRYGRNRRSRNPERLIRVIKKKSGGIRKLMRLAKGNNPNYVYDIVSLGQISGSYEKITRLRLCANLTEFPQINGAMSALALPNVQYSSYRREFKPLKVWVKFIPKRAHTIKMGNVDKVPEVVDGQIPYLHTWPLQHSRADFGQTVQTGIEPYSVKRASGVKYIPFNKISASIMKHAPFYEKVETIVAGSTTTTLDTPLNSVPWLDYVNFDKFTVGNVDVQLPQFYSATPTTDTRETPKYEIQLHIIGKFRTFTNNLLES